MRSYLIFNDIRSDSMKIYIEHLPPIVKPPERYDTIRIDGSSVIEFNPKGYDAYEKSIKIGFTEDNIDAVANWLRGKGKLIMSNELDKYYDVYIPGQIDYEKALRFRMADITFITQPYKHSSTEVETEAMEVINQGNTDCLPLMTIYGSGLVNVFVNDVKVCSIIVNEYVTLDGEAQEAYKGALSQNRVMIGDFPVLKPGVNTLSFTGTVTTVKTLVRSRWL